MSSDPKLSDYFKDPQHNDLSCQLLAFQLGKDPKVSSFDLSEVNPKFDRDHQTAKLAARTIWAFLLGVAHRMA